MTEDEIKRAIFKGRLLLAGLAVMLVLALIRLLTS